VNETLGVAELMACVDEVKDPGLRRSLDRIRDDEARHAALAWAALRWMLDRADASALASVARAFEDAMLRAGAGAEDAPPAAPALGLLPADALAEVRARALDEVVRPLRDAVLAATAARPLAA
jgi:hypothetical protein